MPQDGDYNVEADTEKNRLYITLEGMVPMEMAEDVLDEIRNGVDRLDEGFDVITDISEFEPSTSDSVEEITKGKRAIAEGGASAVVRVTGRSTIGRMQFERYGNEEESYPVAEAESVEEAKELLEELRKKES